MAGTKGRAETSSPGPTGSTPGTEIIIQQLLRRPARASDVELIGEMQESGFKDRQWLARRGGRFIQLTEPLYRVLEYSDGTRSPAEIAEAVTENSPWAVGEDVVVHIILTKLLPLGLIGPRATTDPSRSSSALSVNLRMKMLQPRQIEPMTAGLQWLYRPAILLPLLLVIAAAHVWMYAIHGITRAIHQAFYTPGLLLVVFAILLLSIVFHEFGHAAALRYGGGRVGGMGVGFYLMYPAFYTDTTDSYRLGRWGRVRTDLGGFYFHLIFSLGMILLAVATHHEFLLFVSILINADLVRQMLPFARFDGYWALVDLTGMPDFFSQIKPFLRRRLPGRSRGATLPRLKGWVKAVFIAYIAATFPVILGLLLLTLTRLPMLAAILSGSLRQQAAFAGSALHHHNALLLTASVVQMALLSFEVVGLVHLLYVSVARPLMGAWNRINPLPPTRRAATITTAAAFCLGTFLAFPQVLYTPGDLAALTLPAHHFSSAVAPPVRHTGRPREAGGAGVTFHPAPSRSDEGNGRTAADNELSPVALLAPPSTRLAQLSSSTTPRRKAAAPKPCILPQKHQKQAKGRRS
jgi:putative peptide zinc metalloprotease protein